jgi:endonuclease YncB( thermonuclease family)
VSGKRNYWAALRAAQVAGWHWPDATIPSVTDGDTLDALVAKSFDVGFGGSTSTSFRARLRLARINAPKGSAPGGAASAAWLAGLLRAQPVVDLVTLDAYKYGGPQYSPGEWMAELTLPDGRNVSDLSVSLGFSIYWSGHGPRPGG